MRRREFVGVVVASPSAWSRQVRAQTAARVRRVGVLLTSAESDPDSKERSEALERGLAELGWARHNLQITYRYGLGEVEPSRRAAAELLTLAPEVIVAAGSTGLAVFKQLGLSVPIVFVSVSEPVAQGFIKSLTDPGGNITGFTNLEPTVGPKWLGLLKELAPVVSRVGSLFNPTTAPYGVLFSDAIKVAAPTFGVEPVEAVVRHSSEIETVLAGLANEPGAGLIIMPDTFTTVHRLQISELARRYRIPSIGPFRFFPVVGALASYGVEVPDLYYRTAAYVDRILRGELPSKLPVQQPTTFRMVINLTTAKGLGLTVPPTLLARADEVIE